MNASSIAEVSHHIGQIGPQLRRCSSTRSDWVEPPNRTSIYSRACEPKVPVSSPRHRKHQTSSTKQTPQRYCSASAPCHIGQKLLQTNSASSFASANQATQPLERFLQIALGRALVQIVDAHPSWCHHL